MMTIAVIMTNNNTNQLHQIGITLLMGPYSLHATYIRLHSCLANLNLRKPSSDQKSNQAMSLEFIQNPTLKELYLGQAQPICSLNISYCLELHHTV